MNSRPLSKVVSPVSQADLIAYLGGGLVESDLLGSLLETATDYVIKFINHDLLRRQWEVFYPAMTYDAANLVVTGCARRTLDLPYTGFLGISEVLVDGEEYEDYEVVSNSCPAYIILDDPYSDIKITYTAGMEMPGYQPDPYDLPENQIPSAIKLAITMIAAYMFDNRSCDLSDLVTKSGAKSLLMPFRVEWGF